VFKVRARTLDDYFAFDPDREGDLRLIDRTIRRSAPPLKRWFVPGAVKGAPGMKMSMIGYGQFSYSVLASPQPVLWPIVGLALQKNYMSLYCSAKTKSGTSFVLASNPALGKAAISKMGVITFETANDLDLGALSALLRALAAGLKAGTLSPSYGRLKRA
jgi:hypothetical protein